MPDVPSTDQNVPATSLEVRERLVEALNLDLIGPGAGHDLASERLPGWVRPSNWYLTGFLIPAGAPPKQGGDIDEDDDLDEMPESAGLAEESTEERKAAKKGFFPSSMGLSFLVPEDSDTVSVTVRWADYRPVPIEGDDGKAASVWQREQNEHTEPISLERAGNYDIADSGGLALHVEVRPIDTAGIAGIPAGTRSVSVFLVNRRKPDEDNPDLAYAFQAEIEVQGERTFVPRPDLRGAQAEDWDEQVADLHYADTPEFATGHGVSADWDIVDGACPRLRTAWIPSVSVEMTKTRGVPAVELSMETLGALDDHAAAEVALRPLVDEYRAWIEGRREEMASLQGGRRDTAEGLLLRAAHAADRIEHGIALLASDEDALDAFRVANRAVASALRQRLGEQFDDRHPPRWRAFQLAFILLNLPGLADPLDPHRETVDLLFFPTGGGKTEAYLGLAAFTMVLRRLRNPGQNGVQGAGVSIIMRYTLRLLTLDQLARASGLVCALELERVADDRAVRRVAVRDRPLGRQGRDAQPHGPQGRKTQRFGARQDPSVQDEPQGKPLPDPARELSVVRDPVRAGLVRPPPDDDRPKELRVVCANFECDFSGDRPLPILAVDESIYRRLPAFLIATADKFASLPWVAETGKLLGGAQRFDRTGFHGPSERGGGQRLDRPLPPPDLVIQDELHLISGPLGTMVGLYEAAIEALCVREMDGRKVRPKIVASTATVRHAQNQIQALFARSMTQIFPPPGPDRRDSFFARSVPVEKTAGRLYLGITSPGRNPKVLMRKVWLALMGAAERAYRDAGGHRNEKNPADPYMTVLGYFNSLRELGGARRILEEEVQNTVKQYGSRKRIGERRGLFQDRRTFSEVVELTSRVSTNQVADARRRLERPFHGPQRVDCAIATNMISVGLDIPRLGLMVVLSQPKTHAEYIQATSRVGRDDRWPGLVVTLLNAHKPRDRSHYERFRHYHETFYRSVEVASVTPFSARALDRGFSGALVGLARHAEAALTPASGVEQIETVRAAIERRLLDTFRERVEQQPFTDEAERDERLRSVQNRVVDLLDSWHTVVEDYRKAGVAVQYQRYELRQPSPLLREMLDKDFESEHHRKFRANRSLRDVEPVVDLFLRDLRGSRVEDGS